MPKNNVTMLGVDNYDNQETIRFKKHATGLQLISDDIGVQTGQTPRKVIWAKARARLYHYEPEKEK
jgi:hypothetical protein